MIKLLKGANAAFLTSLDVIDLALNFYNCDINMLKQKILDDKYGGQIGANFMESFRGREVKTKTGGFRKKIQSFGPDSSHVFDWKQQNGTSKKVTIRDYLKQHYKIDLK